MSKKSFYCWYLGFAEISGSPNQAKISECIRSILIPTNQERNVTPSKVTMSLSENCMRLIDGSIVEIKRNYRRGASNQNFLDQTFKTYKINYENIVQIQRLNNKSEILSCIVKHDTNNNNNNKKPTNYLHLFRCDSDESSKKMEHYLNHFRKQLSRSNNQKEKSSKKIASESFKENDTTPNGHMLNKNLSEDLLKRQMLYRIVNKNSSKVYNSNSTGGTESSSSPHEHSMTSPAASENSFSPHAKELSFSSPNFEHLSREFNEKIQSGQPLLYPPKDYSETQRKKGQLAESENWRSLNPLIVGGIGALNSRQTNQNSSNKELFKSPRSEPTLMSTMTKSICEETREALDYLDEVVNSVLIQPVDTELNLFKYEPPSKEEWPKKNELNLKLNSNLMFDDDDFYSLFNMPVASSRSARSEKPSEEIKINPLHVIDEDTNLKTFIRNDFSEKNVVKKIAGKFNEAELEEAGNNLNLPISASTAKPKKRIFSFKSCKSEKSLANNTTTTKTAAANNGVRNNVLQRLGNYHPQWMSSSLNSSPQQTENIVREIKQKKIQNERLFENNNNLSNSNNNNNNNNKKLNGLRRIPEESIENNYNLKQQYYNNNSEHFNSEFILKPSFYVKNEAVSRVPSETKFKNFVQVQDLRKYEILNRNGRGESESNNETNLAGTFIDVIPSSNISNRVKNNFQKYFQQKQQQLTLSDASNRLGVADLYY